MVAPNLKEASDTNPGNAAVYGAQDIVKMVKVIKGTEPGGERIQITSIEHIDRFQTFAYFVRQIGEQPSATYQAINGNTGLVEFSDSEFAAVMNSAIGALPAPSATAPIGLIIIAGTQLDCTTQTINVNKPCIIDGLGSAVVRKTANYTGVDGAAFSVNSSNVILRNFTVVQTAESTQTNTILVRVRADTDTSIDNILIENLIIRDSYFRGLAVISPNHTSLTEKVIIRNVTIDSTVEDTGIVLGVGTKDCTVTDCRIVEPAGNGISVLGTQSFIKLYGNYIFKTAGVSPSGFGIRVTNIPSADPANMGSCKEVVIRDNQITEHTEFDGIRVEGEAEKVVIANNFVQGTQRDGIVVDKRTISSTDFWAKEVIIDGNIVRDGGRFGIAITSSPSAIEFQAFNISRNYIRDVQGHGINLTSGVNDAVVSNNMIYRYGLDSVADRAGIHVRISSKNAITNNSIFGTAAATWSIFEENNSNQNTIRANNVNKPISFIGADSIISQNQGYKTENSGTASISSGSTSVAVTHGLGSGYTPSLQHIQVTPTTSLGNAATFWVSSPTSNQFTINVNTDPGQTVTFAWQIARR